MTTAGVTDNRKIFAALRHWSVVMALTLAAAVGSKPASAFLARPAISAATGGVTKAPRGWLQFCADNPNECITPAEKSGEVALTPELLEQLFSINHYVNDRVTWVPDGELYGKDEHWAYPLDRGDCEDFVLLKRQLLAKTGWPITALLITVVEGRDANRERHAVLTVRTDKGELVLDNRTPEILFWYETSYHFLTRQSTAGPNIWVVFSDDQPQPLGVPHSSLSSSQTGSTR